MRCFAHFACFCMLFVLCFACHLQTQGRPRMWASARERAALRLQLAQTAPG